MKRLPIHTTIIGIGLLGGVILGYLFFGKIFIKSSYEAKNTFTPTPSIKTEFKRRTIRKVLVETATGCTQMTNDGAVRFLTRCDGEVIDGQRLRDPKYLLLVFNSLATIDTSLYKTPATGMYYTVHIITDDGDEVVYIPSSNGNSSGNGQDTGIGDMIGKVFEDIIPTPTISLVTPTSEPSGIEVQPTPSVTIGPSPTYGPSPTPAPTGGVDKGFSCGFSDGQPGRPRNISNYICTTDPIANP